VRCIKPAETLLALFGSTSKKRCGKPGTVWRVSIRMWPVISCDECQKLRRQHESALRRWAHCAFPQHNELVGGARQAIQLQEEEALVERNAAGNRMNCPSRRLSTMQAPVLVSEHEARSGVMLSTGVAGSGEEQFGKSFHHCVYCRLIPDASSRFEGGSVTRLPSRSITRGTSARGASL